MRIVVIGGGIIGALIAKELSKSAEKVTLIEKKNDFGQGVTKANSAIIHGGYDDPSDSVRGKLCSLGNKMYTDISEELGVPVKRSGSIVVARTDEELSVLDEIYEQGIANEVNGLQIIKKEKLREVEPFLSEEFNYALYCKSAGITEPWMIAIAAVDFARENGAEIIKGDSVIGGELNGHGVKNLELLSGRRIEADLVINATGLYYNQLAALFGVKTPDVHLRKGQYILLDKKASSMVRNVVFPLPGKKGKGKLIVPTIDGGVLLGPTAEDLSEFSPEDVSTTYDGMLGIINSAEELIPGIAKPAWILKSFAGLRPETANKDFYIKAATELDNFITVGAIRSPGLTAAPAIANYVIEELIIKKMGIKISRNNNVKKAGKIERIKEETFEKVSELIERDPLYGKIICQCNQVSEKEIIDAIHEGANTIDGVKFRTRAGFGRCQGGFCISKIAGILARELEISLEDVRLNEKETWIVDGRVRK